MALKWEDTAFKNPLARARGLGSSHGALHHWMGQKVTALANIPLVIWAVWSVVSNNGFTFAEFNNWIVQLPNAVLMGLFILSTFYHAALGLQVVIEDYVHCTCYKVVSLIAVRLALFALAATAIFSILKLAL